MGRGSRRYLLAGLVASVALGCAALPVGPPLLAHPTDIGFWDLGGQSVQGTDWAFSGDFAIGAGAWESVTLSNYGSCWVGPNDPLAGTAHAGGVYWLTDLQPQPPSAAGVSYSGTLVRGETAGTVSLTQTDDGSGPLTHIAISLSGSDLALFQDTRLEVCLLGSS